MRLIVTNFKVKKMASFVVRFKTNRLGWNWLFQMYDRPTSGLCKC